MVSLMIVSELIQKWEQRLERFLSKPEVLKGSEHNLYIQETRVKVLQECIKQLREVSDVSKT